MNLSVAGRFQGLVATLGALLVFLTSASLARAQSPTFEYIATLFTETGGVIGVAVPVLIAVALAIFIWGGVVFVFSAGDDTKRKEGQKRMVWGIVGLFVVVSVWGFVILLQIMFGVDGGAESIIIPGIPGADM